MKNVLKTTFFAAGALALAASASAQAADIPCDTAKLIVPWKPGGGTHVIFSIFEKTMQEMDVKPKIKVVTVPGQGGNKGAKEAHGAKPDGCTLFAIHQSAITSFLNGRIKYQYDGFETVANLTSTPDIVGARKGTDFKDFKSFVANAKANPGKLKAGTTFGSTSHFMWLILADKLGVEFSYVPYDGTRERMTALLSGAIDLGSLNVASGRKYLESGELQGFAIAGHKRSKFLTAMPTLKEEGVDMTFALQRGIVAPKGTPKDVIEHWTKIFKAAAENPGLLKQMESKGTDVSYQTPEEFRAWADAVFADYKKVAIKIGMYKE